MDSQDIVPQNPDTSTVVTGNTSHYVNEVKGFEMVALAATFLAAVQAQVMVTTISIDRNEETIPLRAVNSLFLASFSFCITSAILAFLTARWLQCLTAHERSYFEFVFKVEERRRLQRFDTSDRLRDVEQAITVRPSLDRFQPSSKEDESPVHPPRLIHTFFAHTLYVPLSLLVVGFLSMAMGLLVLAWTEHSLAVGIVLTGVYLILLPFSIGVILIRQRPHTRLAVIQALAKRGGDW